MKTSKITLGRAFPFILIIGGAIGIFASITLSYETLQVAKNSHYVPYCNLNPLLNCGTIINTAGDTILKVPYPFYGIGAFAALITIGTTILAGGKFKRWFWQLAQAGVSLGLIGAYFLLLKSMFKIHALCPYCLSVDVVITTVFWYLTLYNIDNNNLKLSRFNKSENYLWIRKYNWQLLLLWFLVVIVFILNHFWYYYGKHL
ncbi:MAG: vitamin K epoxide reductase family protein [Candidatus Saccharimonadales bacterium]